MRSPGRSGGREVVEGQKNGLYVYDRDAVPRDEKGWPVYAVRLDDDRPVCGSPKSRGRGFCESPVRFSNGRCNKHGGSSPKGAASGTFKTGKYSRYMPPPNLYQNYLRSLDDPELTHHRDSLALTDALIADVLESYEDGATAGLWKRVRALYARTEAANRVGNPRKARQFFDELGHTIEQGSRQAGRQQEIMRLLESRRRHAESETRRRSKEQVMFTYEQAYTFYTAVGAAARKHFGHDEERLRAFVNEVSAIARESGMGVGT
jgi:hypothetical protein